jgi:hypothetical protein
MFEDRILRRTFEPKEENATGGKRKGFNENLHNSYRFT